MTFDLDLLLTLTGYRLKNFKVFATMAEYDATTAESAASTLCRHIVEPMAQGATVFFECDDDVVGRYVTVQQENTDSMSPLHFCEMEVYGFDPNSECVCAINIQFNSLQFNSITYKRPLHCK
jgi:hypothetical protein